MNQDELRLAEREAARKAICQFVKVIERDIDKRMAAWISKNDLRHHKSKFLKKTLVRYQSGVSKK